MCEFRINCEPGCDPNPWCTRDPGMIESGFTWIPGMGGSLSLSLELV